MFARSQTVTIVAAFWLALVAFGLQYSTDAYEVGLSAGMFDEPAHFVTGVMAHDYLRSGLGDPFAFAVDYYLHYPAVAIGHWPPMLYGVQALWYLPFGPSLEAALALNALLAALAGVLVFRIGAGLVGLAPGFAAALAFLMLPDMTTLSSHVMAEPLMAVFALAAIDQLIRFCSRGEWRALYAYSAFASAAILTKAVAWSLAPLPLAVALMSGRRDWLRSEKFWSAQALVFLLCGTWELGARRMVSAGFVREPEPLIQKTAAVVSLFGWTVGWGILALAVVGSVAVFRTCSAEERKPWTPLFALVAACIALVWVAPVPTASRYLLLTWAAILLLAAKALSAGAHRMLGLRRAGPAAAIVLVLLASARLSWPTKGPNGFDEAVADLMNRPELADAVWLISSESGGEVLFVGEAARLENPPRRRILRASKYLARASWMPNGEYVSHIKDTAEAMERLLEAPVGVLVLHRGARIRKFEHHKILSQLVSEHPANWKPLARYTVGGRRGDPPGALEVFELRGRRALPPGVIRLDMTSVLGRRLEAPTQRDWR